MEKEKCTDSSSVDGIYVVDSNSYISDALECINDCIDEIIIRRGYLTIHDYQTVVTLVQEWYNIPFRNLFMASTTVCLDDTITRFYGWDSLGVFEVENAELGSCANLILKKAKKLDQSHFKVNYASDPRTITYWHLSNRGRDKKRQVPEELWSKVAEYCYNDVIATEAAFNARQNKDNVNHPEHYTAANGMEVIDVIETFTKGLEGIEATDTGNIIKYICRWKKKNGVEDLKKAEWYIRHLIDVVEGGNE